MEQSEAAPSGTQRETSGAQGGANGSKEKVSVVSIKSKDALLAVDVRPGWAEVWIDGTQQGHTPIQLTVEPGRHKIELKNEELNYHRVYQKQFRAGKKVKISDTIEGQPQ